MILDHDLIAPICHLIQTMFEEVRWFSMLNKIILIDDAVCSQQLNPKIDFFGQNLAKSSISTPRCHMSYQSPTVAHTWSIRVVET
jgi:hypothetical protein